MEVNTEGYRGAFHKTALVKTNDPDKAKFVVSLDGEAKPLFVSKPYHYFALATEVGKRVSRTMTLTNNLPNPVEITGVSHTYRDEAEVVLETVDKGRTYRLTLIAEAARPIKRGGRIYLKLKGAPVKEYYYSAFIEVRDPNRKK